MMSYRPNFVLVDRRPQSATASRPVVSLFPQAFRFAVPEHLTGKPAAAKADSRKAAK
jgi:hypothetical protein